MTRRYCTANLDRREAQILDPNSEENRQYEAQRARDPEAFNKPKADPRPRSHQHLDHDPTLPSILGGNSLRAEPIAEDAHGTYSS